MKKAVRTVWDTGAPRGKCCCAQRRQKSGTSLGREAPGASAVARHRIGRPTPIHAAERYPDLSRTNRGFKHYPHGMSIASLVFLIPRLQLLIGRVIRRWVRIVHIAVTPHIAIGEPLIASMGLALRTMPRAAGVKRGGFIAALATAIQVSAERRRAAVL